MPLSAREARVARMRVEDEALAQGMARLQELRQAELDAKDALAAAQAGLDAVVSEIRAVEKRTGKLQSSLENVRSLHRRELWMDAIPLDVLRLIFDHCVEGLIDAETGLRQPFDFDLRAMPFALATTCSRWRKLALASPELWTYILLTDGDNWNDIQRVHEGISRSMYQSLDVTVQVDECDASHFAAITKVTSAILAHCNRVRTLLLRLPLKVDRNVCMAALKGPTPQLASLLVCFSPRDADGDDDNNDDAGDGESGSDEGGNFYLPHAPRLKRLELQGTRMSCSPLYCRLDTLSDLTIWSGIALNQFLDLAKCASSTLRKLKLTSSWEIPAGVHPVTLHHVTDLTLQTFSPLLHLVLNAPRVRRLGLEAGLICEDMSHVINHFASTVTVLEIVEGYELEDVHVLQAFRQVDEVTFTSDPDADIPVKWDLLLNEVATSSPPIWPKLASLRLGEGTGKALGDGLLNVVRTRSLQTNNEVHPASTERPSKLAAVELVGSGAPEWLCSSVAHLLARAEI